MEGKGKITRDRIIEKSAELFNQYGYNGCALSDIMEATQLQKGGIYNHFEGKEQIASEAFSFAFEKVMERFINETEDDKNSYEKLNSILEVFQSFLTNPILPGGSPLLNLAIGVNGEQTILIDKIKTFFDSLQKFISELLEQGQNKHEFKPSIKPEEMATVLISSLEGSLILCRVHGSDKPLKQTISFFKAYIYNHVLN